MDLKSTLIEFNLVDKELFKPIKKNIMVNSIYVYDGIVDKPDNKIIYNTKLVQEIKKLLPQFEFIFSSKLNLKNEDMPEIYSQCFIGLRLTNSDGNANTVQEFESMKIPIIHNHSNYGLKWKNKDDILELINYFYKNSYQNTNHFTLEDLDCLNIENNKTYELLTKNNNGDCINETNFINNVISKGKTLYFNNKFITGDNNKIPEITISRDKNFNDIIYKKNVFLSPIPYKRKSQGLYFITKSMINEINNKNSLLYPHVFDYKLYNEINSKKIFTGTDVDKNWYNWLDDQKVKELKLKHFAEDTFVICICGRIAINSYPKSLLESIKILRDQGHNIQLLVLAELKSKSTSRLTKNLYDEITSYNWVKSFM